MRLLKEKSNTGAAIRPNMLGEPRQRLRLSGGFDPQAHRPRDGRPKQGAAQPARFTSGFTLIEILIVIVILGIATVVATANLFQSDEEKLQQEAEKLLAVLQIARDEAAFGGRIIAVVIIDNKIQFLERDVADPSRWNVSVIEALKPRMLSDAFNAQLRVGTASVDAKDNLVTFLPIGVSAPFEITLRAPAGSRKIAGDAIGNMRLTKNPV